MISPDEEFSQYNFFEMSKLTNNIPLLLAMERTELIALIQELARRVKLYDCLINTDTVIGN